MIWARSQAVTVGIVAGVAVALAGCPGAGKKTVEGRMEGGTASSLPSSGLPTRVPPASPSCGGTFSPPRSFASLAKRADPGVVTIFSRVERGTLLGGRRAVQGLGSGFIYDKSGMILTNNHVVENASAIQVKFWNGKRVRAKLIGRDKHTDIAVLRVETAEPLTELRLGDSDKVEVGDWVVAIGNPFGLSHTVSAGILSGKGRTRDDVRGLDPTGYFNFLQTDAAINQGNSGGPLLDLRGNVVGINTAIRANANSIGFAIPINMVRQLLPILVAHGKVERSALGLAVRELDEQDLEAMGLSDARGALVLRVVPGSGADRAGIRPKDVVVEFDGHEIRNPDALRWWASIAGVGKVATVKVARGKRVFSLKVKLGKLPQSDDDSAEQP